MNRERVTIIFGEGHLRVLIFSSLLMVGSQSLKGDSNNQILAAFVFYH